MDLDRLQELEKLAGLQLEPQELDKFLADMIALEEFVSRLPDFGDDRDDPGIGNRNS